MEMKILHKGIGELEILFALVVEEVGEARIISQRIEIIMNPSCSQEFITRPFTRPNFRDTREIILGLFYSPYFVYPSRFG